ncbi:hypothetical protein FB451DRAFT_1224658 [Mycena latifolia]|nr:hypothetical protein FB451DRAFT_1224658 [Mycena latifolia]
MRNINPSHRNCNTTELGARVRAMIDDPRVGRGRWWWVNDGTRKRPGLQIASPNMWTNALPATSPMRITPGVRTGDAPDVPAVPVLDGVLVTVSILLALSWHVDSTVVPSVVASKCTSTQSAHRALVELVPAVLLSAVNSAPALYAQPGMSLSGKGMRTPPKREQQALTAVSLFAQHPGEAGTVVVALAARTWLMAVGFPAGGPWTGLYRMNGERPFEAQSPTSGDKGF